jgi:hypothetical protein
MVKQLIDWHGEVTTIIPNNLPPHEVQYIIDTIESTRYVREPYTDFPFGILVPDVNYITTPLILNDAEEEERPIIFVQRFYINPASSDVLVPDMIYNATPPTSNGLALEEEPNQAAQGFHPNFTMSDASTPDIDHSILSSPLNGLGLNEPDHI